MDHLEYLSRIGKKGYQKKLKKYGKKKIQRQARINGKLGGRPRLAQPTENALYRRRYRKRSQRRYALEQTETRSLNCEN